MGAVGGEELVPVPAGCGERIFVAVRLRPLNEKEIERKDVSDWESINDNTIIYRNGLSISERSMYPTAYTFDRVFSYECSTRKVYEEGAKEFALSVVRGINTTVFAYGQTSSGKTYTMTGITKYTVADIYDYIEKNMERDFLLKFSAIEIYNESVRDLLSADTTPLRLLDDPERGTIVEKLTEETIRDRNHFKELLSVCEAHRQIGETSLNEASSRSHQILRLTIESSAREHDFLGNDKSSSLAATVNFVDLAGSERASQTSSAGVRLKEGSHINRSLLTLGTVIRKLSKGRNGHVPFRDSKLTRILQSSLGGNARTAVICTMSPARSHVEQSRNTLLFACCAKDVTTNAQVNVVVSDKALVKQLQRELAKLESEMQSSGQSRLISDPDALLREKDLQIEQLKEEIKELILQRDLARSEVKLLQMNGGYKSSTSSSGSDDHYPKLRVQASCEFENQISATPSSENLKCLVLGVGSLYASQDSDGHSSCFEQNSPLFQDNFPNIDSQPSVNTRTVNFKPRQENIQEHSNDNIDDLCKEVRCIEMEEPSANRKVTWTTSDLSPNRYIDSNMSSPIDNRATSPVKMIENGDEPNFEFQSPTLKEDIMLNSFNPIFIIRSPERSSRRTCFGSLKLIRSRSCNASLMGSMSFKDWFQKMERNENSPPTWQDKDSAGKPEIFIKELPELQYGAEIERLSRNGSQASIGGDAVTELNAYSINVLNTEKGSSNNASAVGTEEMADSQSGNQRPDNKVLDIESKAVDSGKNVEDVGVDPIQNDVMKSPSRLHSFKGPQSKVLDAELKPDESVKNVEDVGLDPIQDNAMKSPSRLPSFKGLQSKVLDAALEPVESVKNVDVGLYPILDTMRSPSRLHSEFKGLQSKIIELWHACNVSLVHRTYFFLLIKEDPSDSIYLEVEFRRLSFLRETFSQQNQTEESLRSPTPSSSTRDLRHERQMLSRLMRKRLSKQDRKALFVEWGIKLNAKNRRLQLTNRLWTDTKDLDHIKQSASLVAKLVGYVKPEQAFKDLFGLNFMLIHRCRESRRLKRLDIKSLW